MADFKSNKERIQNAKDELNNWIEMQNGIIPSEDLEEFEETITERKWLIEQAEMLEKIRDEVENLYADEIDLSDFGERVMAII